MLLRRRRARGVRAVARLGTGRRRRRHRGHHHAVRTHLPAHRPRPGPLVGRAPAGARHGPRVRRAQLVVPAVEPGHAAGQGQRRDRAQRRRRCVRGRRLLADQLRAAVGDRPGVHGDLRDDARARRPRRARASWTGRRRVRDETMVLSWLVSVGAGATIIVWLPAFLDLWVGAKYDAGTVATVLICVMVAQLALIRVDANVIDLTLRVRAKVLLGLFSALLGAGLGILLGRALRAGHPRAGDRLHPAAASRSRSPTPSSSGACWSGRTRSTLRAVWRPALASVLLGVLALAARPLVGADGWFSLVALGSLSAGALLLLAYALGLDRDTAAQRPQPAHQGGAAAMTDLLPRGRRCPDPRPCPGRDRHLVDGGWRGPACGGQARRRPGAPRTARRPGAGARPRPLPRRDPARGPGGRPRRAADGDGGAPAGPLPAARAARGRPVRPRLRQRGVRRRPRPRPVRRTAGRQRAQHPLDDRRAHHAPAYPADAEAGPLGLPARRCRRRRLRGCGPRPGHRFRARGVLRAGAEQPRRHPRGDPHAEPAGLPPVVARPVPDGRARGRPARPAEGPRHPGRGLRPRGPRAPGAARRAGRGAAASRPGGGRSPGTGWPVASTCRASWTTPTRRWPPRTCSCSRPGGRARRAC